MRFVDVIYAIPLVLLVLLFLNWWGSGLINIFIAIGIVGWVTMARLVRGQFLTLREQEYVKASRVAGAGAGYRSFSSRLSVSSVSESSRRRRVGDRWSAKGAGSAIFSPIRTC
jgi:hypothetical protein